MDGKDELILTGQLGDVMKESARAALSYIRARGRELGIDPAVFEKQTLHIHVPAGATPKDGPSAGSPWPPPWSRCSPGDRCAATSR